MMHWIHVFFHLVYMTTFNPEGYVYARGEWIGFISEMSKQGYIFKTWEGKIRSQKDITEEEVRKYSFIDCVSEQQFSIDPKDFPLVFKIREAALRGRPVILTFERRIYPLHMIHGDTNVFVTGIKEFK